ncbi:MAG: hypothetical protein R3C05_23255 [Pirellulaceae bacterium]
MQHTVNLMPLAFRRRQSAKQILCGWVLIGFLACITMLMLWLVRDHGNTDAELAALERESGPVIAMQQRTLSLEKELAQLRKRSELLDRLRPHDSALQTIGAVAAACASSEQSIRVQTLELIMNDKVRLQPKQTDAKSGDSESTRNSAKLIMQLHAEVDQSISQVVGRLEKNPRFGRIELKNASGTRDESARLVELHSEIQVGGGIE